MQELPRSVRPWLTNGPAAMGAGASHLCCTKGPLGRDGRLWWRPSPGRRRSGGVLILWYEVVIVRPMGRWVPCTLLSLFDAFPRSSVMTQVPIL